jgi:hypothetical protein
MTDWRAEVGDEVAVGSHRLRGGRKKGTIREVLGMPGHEYYRVLWENGHESVFHPGSDATLLAKRRRKAGSAPPKPVRAATSRRPEAPEPPPRPKPRAVAGDRLVIKGHRLGERDRDAEIVEVLGPDGAPPYRVLWSDTGREGLLFPGTDAVVEHFPRRRRASPRG